MSKIIFIKEQFFSGLLNLTAISLLIFASVYLIFNNYALSIFLTLIISFILFIFINKRWFKKIVLEEEKIILNYPFNIFGERIKTIYYDEKISKVIYYDYMYRTPSHCKIISKKDIYRFNCTIDEAKKLNTFFKSKNIHFLFNDEKKVSYR